MQYNNSYNNDAIIIIAIIIIVINCYYYLQINDNHIIDNINLDLIMNKTVINMRTHLHLLYFWFLCEDARQGFS